MGGENIKRTEGGGGQHKEDSHKTEGGENSRKTEGGGNIKRKRTSTRQRGGNIKIITARQGGGGAT